MKKQLLFLVMTLIPMLASADAVEIDGIYYLLNNQNMKYFSQKKQVRASEKPTRKRRASPTCGARDGRQNGLRHIFAIST